MATLNFNREGRDEGNKRAEIVEVAFRQLQPICVPLAQNPTPDLLRKLQECVTQLPKEAVEELQEYIMFPMRFLLKQNKNLKEDMSIQTIVCLRLVLERCSLSRWQTFTDLLTGLCVQLGGPPSLGLDTDKCEELKMELVLCIKQLMLAATNSVVKAVYDREFLPMFGHCVSVLLTVLQREKNRELCIQAILTLQAATQLHPRKVGLQVRRCVGDMFASFLPGILIALTKVVTGDSKQGYKIITTSLTLWHQVATLVLGKKYLPTNKETSSHNINNKKTSPSSNDPERKQRLASLAVDRTDVEWLKGAGERVAILAKRVCDALKGSGSWRWRAGLVEWASALLADCEETLPSCCPELLEVLVSLVGDENTAVAHAAQQALRSHRPADSLLQDNLYTLCTAMPRVVRSQDDAATLSSLRTLRGYVSLLGPRVHVVLRSRPHLSKLCQALLHLLTLDSSQITVLQERTLGSPYSELNKSDWQERAKRQFKYFHDPQVYSEVIGICQLLGYYGDLDIVLDPFLCEFEQTTVNRKQAALVINNLMMGVIKDESALSLKTEQRLGTDDLQALVKSLTDMYLSADFFSVTTSNQSESLKQPAAHNEAFDWQIVATGYQQEVGPKVEHYNSNILQICVLLEGIGAFAKVVGSEFRYLLLDVLYPVLEKLGDENAMISQSAYLTLTDIAGACNYSTIAELLQENADYLVSSISMRLRHLARYPQAPNVLRVVIMYCGTPDILQHLHHTLQEVLSSLDHHYGDNAVPFMRVLNTLVKAVETWYPSKHSTAEGRNAVQGTDTAKSCDKNDSDTKTSDVNETETKEKSEETMTKKKTKVSLIDTNKTKDNCSINRNSNSKETITKSSTESNPKPKESLADYLLSLHKTHLEAEGEFEEDRESGVEDMKEAPDATEEEDMDVPREEEKKVIPVHVKMVMEVFERCCHLLADSDPRLRLLVLDTVAQCSLALADHTDELLPLVHRVWPAFVKRFTDQEPQVTIKACEVLSTLGRTSEDFIRQRVVKDVLPKLNDYLAKQAQISERAGKRPMYRYSVACRLQLCVVARVGELCASTGLQEEALARTLSACVPYLSARQPVYLQEACIDTLRRFIGVDPDLVWLTLHDLYCPRPFDLPSQEFKVVNVMGSRKRNEYSDNVVLLLAALEKVH